MAQLFQKTPAQRKALRLLTGPSRYVLLFGGSRSGKTFILVYAVLVRALRAAGTRFCGCTATACASRCCSTRCPRWRNSPSPA